MEIHIVPIAAEQKSVFRQMLELYSYDFSEFSEEDVNEEGYFGYSYIDVYWTEEGRYPFFIRVDGKLAWVVLIRSCCEYNRLENAHSIAEFFVMKKYRKKGVGREAARQIFDMFPGCWEISYWTANLPAKTFWMKVVNEYTEGRYHTFCIREENIAGFMFDNSRIGKYV